MKEPQLPLGFTLIECIVALTIVSILGMAVVASFQSLQTEAYYTKAEEELSTLKVAIASYWQHNEHSYPNNIHTALTGAVPQIISTTIADPWSTDSTNATYGYTTGVDGTFGGWFIIYTQGPNSDTNPSWDTSNQRVEYSGRGRVISNAPVHQN